MRCIPFNQNHAGLRLLGILFVSVGSLTCLAQPPVAITENPEVAVSKSTFSAPIKKIAPAVVNIYSTKRVEGGSAMYRDPLFRDFFKDASPKTHVFQEDMGSGVIITPDGYILTNFHVVDDAQDVQVALTDDREFPATVVGVDPSTDLAILKIKATNLPVAELGNSDDAEVGDVVLAVGNPFGVGQTVTMGIISATDRGGFGIVDYEDFIQIDAAINPGNSGGALCNTKGQVIGINTAMLANTGSSPGIGFAVPANLARYVVQQILREGRVVRGSLGLSIQPLTPGLARHFGVPGQRGALIDDVAPNSAAKLAGMLPGDIIIEFNGAKVTNPRNLRLNIGKTRPGTQAPVVILRKGEKLTMTAQLKEIPTPTKASLPGKRVQAEVTDALDGVTVTDLEDNYRQRLKINAAIQGALVLSVDVGSPAYAAGLRAGDVIEEINHEITKNSYQAVTTSRKSPTIDDILLRIWSKGSSRYLNISTESRKLQTPPPLTYH